MHILEVREPALWLEGYQQGPNEVPLRKTTNHQLLPECCGFYCPLVFTSVCMWVFHFTGGLHVIRVCHLTSLSLFTCRLILCFHWLLEKTVQITPLTTGLCMSRENVTCLINSECSEMQSGGKKWPSSNATRFSLQLLTSTAPNSED